MSRTYKDTPFKVREERFSSWGFKREDKPKKRKEQDTEYHWMGTPSWWTHEFMIRPRRVFENQSLRVLPEDLEDFDFVDIKRKNHKYYW